MESQEVTSNDKVSNSTEKKNASLKKRGFSSRLNRAVKSGLKKKTANSKMNFRANKDNLKSPQKYKNQALMDIVSRNEHFQTKDGYNTAITGLNKGVKISTRKLRYKLVFQKFFIIII